MFKMKQIISKAKLFHVPVLQYFPITIQKRNKNSNTQIESENDLKDLVNYCLLMGYSGSKYRGMEYQATKGVVTVEGTLFEAMLKSNWIVKSSYYRPRRIRYQHASRTDKGVSAARQCCSIRLPVGLNIQEINDKLPDDIRVFGLKQASDSFNARFYCRTRTYTYTLPSIAFCDYQDQISLRDYRITSDKLKFINDLLQVYNGNKNFHNFTIQKLDRYKLSWRQMTHLECTAPFLVDDVEFCVIRIRGSSFMMHQIRKMIGLLLAVVRKVIDSTIFDSVFTEKLINCPTAPGLGLVLERLHYDDYDKHIIGMYEKLTWEEFDEDVEQFHEKFIKQNIVQTELREEVMFQWLEHLLNYSYIPVIGSDSSTTNDSSATSDSSPPSSHEASI